MKDELARIAGVILANLLLAALILWSIGVLFPSTDTPVEWRTVAAAAVLFMITKQLASLVGGKK